jgi:CheY-like chemotaxis protein
MQLNYIPPAYDKGIVATNLFSPTIKQSPKSPGAAGDAFKNEAGEKRRALVVDDVPDVTEMISVLLKHAGFEVVTAHSAQQAIDVARQLRLDLVISDIGMPEMNGYELAQNLRALPGCEKVPMIAVTGYSMFDDRQRSVASGFNAHMTKPIDPAALLELIEQL